MTTAPTSGRPVATTIPLDASVAPPDHRARLLGRPPARHPRRRRRGRGPVQRQRAGLGRRRHRLRQAGRPRHRVRRRHRHHRRRASSAPASTSATPTVEIVEVDGLEGDDEFFVQSTAFGVAYRVIGGLGSDTINVTGDVTEDIVTRELEGISGAVDHLVRSRPTSTTTALPVDGIELNVATPETRATSSSPRPTASPSVRESGAPGPGRRRRSTVDKYSIRLAAGSLRRHPGLRHRLGGTLAAGGGRRPARQPDAAHQRPRRHDLAVHRRHRRRLRRVGEYQAHSSTLNGAAVDADRRPRARAHVHRRHGEQFVYVWAVDDDGNASTPEIDAAPRATASSSSSTRVISADPTLRRHRRPQRRGDRARQRHAGRLSSPRSSPARASRTAARSSSRAATRRLATVHRADDELLVELAKEIADRQRVVVELVLDADERAGIQLSVDDAPIRRRTFNAGGHARRITFDAANWDDPGPRSASPRATTSAREDPQTAVITFRARRRPPTDRLRLPEPPLRARPASTSR